MTFKTKTNILKNFSYAIQIQSYTFSAIHVQMGVEMGADLIRVAFEQSRDSQKRVFLTGPNSAINQDAKKENFQHREIKRRNNHVIWVWSAPTVNDHMYRQFNGH